MADNTIPNRTWIENNTDGEDGARPHSNFVRASITRQGSQEVTNPLHYTSDPSGVECIEITRHRNFNIGNAFKYLWRAGLKDESKTIQDLEKAIFYIKDEIHRLQGGNK
jgi:hypothetical protein